MEAIHFGASSRTRNQRHHSKGRAYSPKRVHGCARSYQAACPSISPGFPYGRLYGGDVRSVESREKPIFVVMDGTRIEPATLGRAKAIGSKLETGHCTWLKKILAIKQLGIVGGCRNGPPLPP